MSGSVHWLITRSGSVPRRLVAERQLCSRLNGEIRDVSHT